MRFLIITQDLRVSGTSQGIIERSFLSKLRKVYPEASIDVLYLHSHSQDDALEILPVNSIIKKKINTTIPFHIKWINRISRRLFNYLYAEHYIHKQFAKEIKKVDYTLYDHIMVRSAGLDHETLLAMHNLPILKHTIVNFHDPYPYAWYKGMASKVNSNEFKKLHKIIQIVSDAKACCASAYYMAKDLQYLYASDKFFYTLPHQFSLEGFDLSDKTKVRKKDKKIQISYHGALMFGRNIFTIVEAFKQLMHEHDWIKHDVEFVLRVKGDGVNKLKEETKEQENILVLDTLNFSNSSNEQIHESDINIILENGPYYSNILGGKVPFLFSLDKKVFVSSPERSELRRYLGNYPFLCDMNDFDDTKSKLYDVLTSESNHNSVGKELFSDVSFKKAMDKILHNQKNVND
jgi:glycosyltransferase involved in cell wall biosynthesis